MKRFLAMLMALILIAASALPVLADSGEYLVLGADLTPQEQATVLKLLGVKDINDYNVSYITNQEEHEALGNYLPDEVIGSRALSSVLLKSNRNGINVDTQNINYVTKEMYQNALITAGLKNVDMQVAGPSSISGTAALVAATKAYEIMTGEEINQENVDTANQELVVTQDLANEVGDAEATELVAALKQQVVENDYTPEQIAQALDNLEAQMGLQITPETKAQIIDLMEKVNQIDIDPNAIRDQAENIYNSIQGYVTGAAGTGFFDKITQAVKNFLDTIFNFFSGRRGDNNQNATDNSSNNTTNEAEKEDNTQNNSNSSTNNGNNNQQESTNQNSTTNGNGSSSQNSSSGNSNQNGQNSNNSNNNTETIETEEFENVTDNGNSVEEEDVITEQGTGNNQSAGTSTEGTGSYTETVENGTSNIIQNTNNGSSQSGSNGSQRTTDSVGN